MTRVLLINPPSPEQLGAPLLGLQYVAASLLARGCEVRVIDGAARYSHCTAEEIVATAETFAPDIVGFSLFTRWVWHAYRLAEKFRGRFPLLVAGGAHTTACPTETLEQGFDVAVTGEAEHSMVHLVDWLGGMRKLEEIPGILFRDRHNRIRAGPPAEPIPDLDRLPLPQNAQHLFDSRWYHPQDGEVIPGGVLTSRGCPAKCTFCANYVTGRGFRYRSPELVADELNRYHQRYGASFFPCWDDALTANRPHLFRLCQVLEEQVRFPLLWSAITRASMVTPEVLRALKRAGCVSVNFGVESGDDQILKVIKKGITTEQVVRALEWAKAEGMTTACNFMLGFPQETPHALERTLRFMERIAPLVDTFSTLGVVVPFPGTPIYDEFHEAHGFTRWWLRESFSHYTPPPPLSDFDRFYRHYIDDTNLELDFFHYTPEMREMIRACMRFKAEHNLTRMGLLKDPVYQPRVADSEACA